MNPGLYHKFLDISIIPAGLNPIEANKPLDGGGGGRTRQQVKWWKFQFTQSAVNKLLDTSSQYECGLYAPFAPFKGPWQNQPCLHVYLSFPVEGDLRGQYLGVADSRRPQLRLGEITTTTTVVSLARTRTCG
jgi:hypothetical protein